MPGARSLRDLLHNLLQDSDLTFRDFVELALYHPEFGYYMRPLSPVGKGGDYVTSPLLSPVFAFAVGRVCSEFVYRAGGEGCSIVEIGSGMSGFISGLVSKR